MTKQLFAAVAVVIVAGCSQNAPVQPEPTTVTLQCDGVVTSRDRLSVNTSHQRRTYRIDLEGKSVALWDADNEKFVRVKDLNPGTTEALDVTPARIVWTFKNQIDEATFITRTTFDRTLGTVSSILDMVTILGPDKVTFEGPCVKVDAPSTQTAF